jgi:hypothetical protein
MPQPLTTQITIALALLRQARYDGNARRIYRAQHQLDQLLDQYPRQGPPPARNSPTKGHANA